MNVKKDLVYAAMGNVETQKEAFNAFVILDSN